MAMDFEKPSQLSGWCSKKSIYIHPL